MYNPDYQVSPGDIIAEYMEVSELSVQSLADVLGEHPIYLNNFLNGYHSLDENLAWKFSKLFNLSYDVLINIDKKYQEFLNKE
jgi:plasmid maintenance system antidote protein VapI